MQVHPDPRTLFNYCQAFNFFIQPGIFHGDPDLVANGLKQVYILLRKLARFPGGQSKRTQCSAFSRNRDADKGVVAKVDDFPPQVVSFRL